MNEILSTFKLASTKNELREINVQVYFWLEIHSNPRTTVPSDTNVAIIGWAGINDLDKIPEKKYETEQRPRIEIPLKDLRTMNELLNYIS